MNCMSVFQPFTKYLGHIYVCVDQHSHYSLNEIVISADLDSKYLSCQVYNARNHVIDKQDI